MQDGDFAALGLSAFEARALTALVRARALRAEELAELLDCPVSTAAAAAERLAQLGLVSRRVEDSGSFVASRPSVALGAMLAGRHAELRQAEAAIQALDDAYTSTQHAHGPSDIVDVILGREAIAARLQQIQLGARNEVLSLVKAPVSVMGSDENTAEDVMVERGVRYRVVLERAMLEEEPRLLDELVRVQERGEQVRLAASVPLKLYVIDRELALVPLGATGAVVEGALLIHRSGLLDALVALFESVWRDAFTLTTSPPKAARATDVDDTEPMEATPRAPLVERRVAGVQEPDEFDLSVLGLLMSGLTDRAVATALRVSPRTVQRRVRAMMTMARVDSRLQLGYAAAQRRWSIGPTESAEQDRQ